MSLVSSPSWGMTVEGLYKMCKPFQSKGFVFETNEDVACASYTLGVVETLLWQCLFSDVEGFESIYPAKGLYANTMDINKVITNFLIFAENNTDEWGASPASLVATTKYLSNKFPCEPTN